MSWLNHFKTDRRMVPEIRKSILSLNLYAANELAKNLNCPITKLAGKLQNIYGIKMSPHGVKTDTDDVKKGYLSIAKREQYRVFMISSRAFNYRSNSNSFKALNSGRAGYRYVLSMGNEMYAAANQTISVGYHSSFMAGMPVQCAGQIWIENGRVTKVSNASGHFQPVDRALVKVLHYLRMNGVTLSKVTVDPQQFKKVGKKVLGEGAGDVMGDVFMRNNGNWNSIIARAKHQSSL